MSDTLAAATLAAAVLQKMDTSGLDLEREATRLYRRYSNVIKRSKEIDEKSSGASAAATSPSYRPASS